MAKTQTPEKPKTDTLAPEPQTAQAVTVIPPDGDDGEDQQESPKDRYNNVIGQFAEREGEILSMLPSNVSREKFKNAVLSAIKRDPMILNAKPRSLMVAFTQAAQDGLLPDGKEGVINVYKGEAKWNPMIGGIRKRARELDRLIIDAQVVHENDKFIWHQGDEPRIEHEPAKLGTPRGNMIGAYAIFKREDGDILHREVMDKPQIMMVKGQSKNQEGLLWTKFETEGWRKTVARRGIKTVPTSEGLMQIVTRDDDSFNFDHPVPVAAISPPPAPPPAPKPTAPKAADPPVPSKPEDQVYQDWLRDSYAELNDCKSDPAVDDLRERVMAELKEPDKQAWKDACAQKATEVFQ